MKNRATLFASCLFLFILFPNHTSKSNLLTRQNQILDCTVDSYYGLIPPVVGFIPVVRETSPIGASIPLLPVPINDVNLNPAFFTRIPRTALLGIIGRAAPEFGEWLYIELRIPDQIFQYGFIPKELTNFTGDISTLEIIPVQECKQGEVNESEGEIVVPQRIEPTSLTNIVIEDITLSLPSNWIYHNFLRDNSIQNQDLDTVLQTIPSIDGVMPTHLLVAASPNDTDILQFGIFYIGNYDLDLVNINSLSQTDKISLANDLETGLENLVPTGFWQTNTKLIDRRVVFINDYPFAYAHFVFEDLLTSEELEEVSITSEQNVMDIYYLITYMNKKWYIIYIAGLRPTAIIHKTIINSVFIP